MPFNFFNLDETTRSYMISEFKADIASNRIYLSKRFNEQGNTIYSDVMNKHLKTGSEVSLSVELSQKNCFKTLEERRTAKGIKMIKVPATASETFSEGEFNRFYIRGLCQRALVERLELEVYRARNSENPRPDSEALIGKKISPSTLLLDLQNNIGIDTALGLPNGPNSGLSIRICNPC